MANVAKINDVFGSLSLEKQNAPESEPPRLDTSERINAPIAYSGNRRLPNSRYSIPNWNGLCWCSNDIFIVSPWTEPSRVGENLDQTGRDQDENSNKFPNSTGNPRKQFVIASAEAGEHRLLLLS
jgi:hypothetical protein